MKSSIAAMVVCASGPAAETADMSGLSAGSVNAPAKPTFPPSLAVRCVSGPAPQIGAQGPAPQRGFRLK